MHIKTKYVKLSKRLKNLCNSMKSIKEKAEEINGEISYDIQ